MRKMTNVLRQNAKKIAAILVCCLMISATSCGSGIEYVDETGYSNSTTEEGSSDDGSDSSSNITYTGDVEYADSDNEEFQKFMKDYFVESVTEDTLTFNYEVKDGSKYGIESPAATLGDASMDKAAIDKQKKNLQDRYDKLMTFKDVKLTEDETFTYECLKSDMEIAIKAFDNIYFYEPFSPMRGLQANIPTNFTDYRFDDKSDVEDYIIMLGQMRQYFKGSIDFEYEKSKAGFFMADAVADKVIEQCDEFTAEKENNFMIEVFNDRVEKLDFLSKEEKEDFKKRDKEAILNSVIPAFEDLKKCMTELKGTGKNSMGICNYEGGKDYYTNYIFPSFSDSAKTPDEEIEVMESRKKNLITEMSLLYSSNPDAYQSYVDNSETILKKYDKMDASEVIDYLIENGHTDIRFIGRLRVPAIRSSASGRQRQVRQPIPIRTMTWPSQKRPISIRLRR